MKLQILCPSSSFCLFFFSQFKLRLSGLENLHRYASFYKHSNTMVKIKTIEYFRVLPRWLFVKVTDEEGQYGWGESTLEGHTEAVEGTLNALCKRFVGYEAE